LLTQIKNFDIENFGLEKNFTHSKEFFLDMIIKLKILLKKKKK
jgi:hypothetical protein